MNDSEEEKRKNCFQPKFQKRAKKQLGVGTKNKRSILGAAFILKQILNPLLTFKLCPSVIREAFEQGYVFAKNILKN
ncbi:MAG: hypothetical protein ACO1OQ_03695 [Rufibacter sp.]